MNDPVPPPEPGKPGFARGTLLAFVPNLLSVFRIALALCFPCVPVGWRALTVLAGGLSDLVDGAFSRLFRVTSTAGQILDPIADKLFVTAVVLTLLVEKQLLLWQAAFVGFRDIAVVAGSGSMVVLRGWSALKHMPPTLVGKLTTALQFAYILALVARPAWAPFLLVPTGLCSVAAGVDYLRTSR